jgi:hypothetical protein
LAIDAGERVSAIDAVRSAMMTIGLLVDAEPAAQGIAWRAGTGAIDADPVRSEQIDAAAGVTAEDAEGTTARDFHGGQATAEQRGIAVGNAVLALWIGEPGTVGATAALPAPVHVTLLQTVGTDAIAVLADVPTMTRAVADVGNALIALAELTTGAGRADAAAAIRVATALAGTRGGTP